MTMPQLCGKSRQHVLPPAPQNIYKPRLEMMSRQSRFTSVSSCLHKVAPLPVPQDHALPSLEPIDFHCALTCLHESFQRLLLLSVANGSCKQGLEGASLH
jgi:hypothetical protein